ncbi:MULTISPECIES: response regulator transcription factor [Bradyrhizobium]|uniref:Two-component system response regulator n=1 Tax=Bradyrhizobium canariense TaxID=255045 RepID=A0ABX3X9S6_9BRAD|nr:response regulator transcription factor [Bradyrhizobium canariense]OSI34747.1 two-component system response regulator [Bradyrhizobium canariense]OSI38611.1 two-component system response regulator [Bradyrhizobium canariense]OSI56949.1 two-component system response regulator [Bradyrhizobium canariense]OSI56969.1 two-component system response regulator [Bradyrhizobium canariense]OSI59763.1 two-component system response regulator [Bradyrhizobium canariense]
MRRIRVVIADRHPIVLQGISSVLAAQRDFAIVAACGDIASCIGAIRLLVPDIALVDIAMPSISRPDILAIANTAGQGTRVIFFAEKAGDQRLQTLAAGRACLVLTRDAEPEMLVATLRKVAERQGPASRSPCTGGEVRGASHTGEEKAPTQLTDRERQIMRLVSEGLSNKEIGRFLSITDGTIKVHLHHIFQKLDISNRTVLAAFAISQNGKHAAARELVSSGLLQQDSAVRNDEDVKRSNVLPERTR